MRTHSIILPALWTGPTGKGITNAGKDARIVSTYKLTCDHANMIGLFRLPLLYIVEETGLKRREVVTAIEQLRSLEFSLYDEATEFVWVREMARIQLGLLPGETLKEEDKRAKGVIAIYKHLPSNPFLGPFFDRYAEVLRLPVRRDFDSERKGLASPFNGASKPLIRGPIHDPDRVPVRKGEKGETSRLPPRLASLEMFEITPELETWAAKEGISNPEQYLSEFRDHWRSVPETKRRTEWAPTFRNRLRWLRDNGKLKPNNGAATCTNRIQNGRFLKACGKLVQDVKPGKPALCPDCSTEASRRHRQLVVQRGASA